MTLTIKKPDEAAPAEPERSEALTAVIDLDRFCEGCAYNLRTMPVHRDPRTGIPVVRCPECGRFQAANDTSTALRPWLRRLTALLLGLWILTLVAGYVSLGVAEGAVSYMTLEELTVRGGYTTQTIGNTTVRTWRGFGPLEIDTGYEPYRLFVSTVLLGSFAVAFACGMFLVVLFPHWRRVAYVAVVLGTPQVAGALIAVAWHQQAPHLFAWGLPYVAAHAGVQTLGGMMGVAFGRPLARLGVRILLPPSVRPRLAYLWLVDGKALEG